MRAEDRESGNGDWESRIGTIRGGQMESVVAQLSAIDVAALYHYHIWPEGRYQTVTEPPRVPLRTNA